MNKLEKNLKIFGSYKFVEITDIIERDFIIKRCFSSYSLIKFSLLNTIAITRGFESQKIKNSKVMETICDFCNRTKKLSRKYMNIFLNIFQELKFNPHIKNKNEFLKCLNIIGKYFAQSNMLPTEETAKVINTFNEKQKGEAGMPITEVKEEFENKESDNKEKQIMNKFIKDKGTFFNEKHRLHFNELLKTIEIIFTGNYTTYSFKYVTYKELSVSLNKKIVKIKDKFIPKTPLKLFYDSGLLLNKYINSNLNIMKDDIDEIISNILSLLFYFKIPVIEEKWIEQYKIRKPIVKKEQELKGKNSKKNEPIIEKTEEEIKEINELKETILIIIAILVDLIDVIQNYFK